MPNNISSITYLVIISTPMYSTEIRRIQHFNRTVEHKFTSKLPNTKHSKYIIIQH